MKKLILFLTLMGSSAFSQVVTSPVPNLSNEISLNKSLTYIYINNPGTQSISTNLSIASNPHGISIAINRCSTIRAKNTCYLVVSFNGYNANLPTLSVGLLNNSSLLTTLKYNANNIESLSVNPTSLSLGTITTAGLTSSQTVTVQNTGNISISPIVSSSNSNLQVSSNSCLNIIAPLSTCSFNVRYNAQNSTSNGTLSGLSISVAPSSNATATQIPVSGILDLPPVLIQASSGSVSSGGSVSADKYVFVYGNTSKSYNSQSNIFYNWGGSNFNSPNTPQPTNIGALLGGRQFSKIASASTHSCAITNDNLAYCWGLQGAGELGYDVNVIQHQSNTTPYPVKMTGALSGKTLKEIGTGQNFTCAIASDNKVYCWGLGTNGQLGNNTDTFSDEPVAVDWSGVLSGKTAKTLNVEQFGACIIASDDLIYCWGFLYSNPNQSLVPYQIPMIGALAGKTVKHVSTSGPTNCLVASDDRPYCWGYNGSGQIGDGTLMDSTVPVPVQYTGDLVGKIIKEIKNTSVATFALTEDNKLIAWGSNWNGMLGTNQVIQDDNQPPQEIYMAGELSGKNIKSVYGSSYDSFLCVIASDNLPYCWGRNDAGHLGLGLSFSQLNYSIYPRKIYTDGALSGKQIKSLHMSTYSSVNHICALASDNNVYCWGPNATGGLGNGTYTQSFFPVLAPTP